MERERKGRDRGERKGKRRWRIRWRRGGKEEDERVHKLHGFIPYLSTRTRLGKTTGGVVVSVHSLEAIN